jgi:hypothetical protein
MSTSNPLKASDPRRIELVPNEEQGTVTFVADLDEDSTTPPTEWITVPAGATIDPAEYR